MEDSKSNIFFTECFVKAILILLKEKPFHEITITEICRKSGISRMTFYRHYHSKEEVFYRYVDWIVEEYKKEIIHDKGFASYIRLEYIVLIFKYFEKYSEVVICMVNHHIDDYLRSTFVQTELNLTLSSDFNQKSRYTAIAYANALYGLLTDWICDGMKQDVQEPAEILYQIFAERIKRY